MLYLAGFIGNKDEAAGEQSVEQSGSQAVGKETELSDENTEYQETAEPDDDPLKEFEKSSESGSELQSGPGSGDEEVSENSSNGFNLLLSSVDHDIKMMILDATGELVRGMGFMAEVVGPDETFSCEDFDKDGVLYTADIVSGYYTVQLKDPSGKNIGIPMGVNVRGEISYTPLESITLEIYSEDEIDVEAEDTGIFDEAVIEEGSTESVTVDKTKPGSIGVDVSKYNKDIDWKAVKASGIDYAIIRIGYRGSSSGVLVVDPYFKKNIEGARAAGLKTGVYFFTQAINAVEAVEEASAVIQMVQASELELPVFIDVETSGGRADSLDIATRTEVINAFCRTLTNSGYGAGVYANKRWFESRIDMSALGNWNIWLARYKADEPGMACDAWQYTSKGSVDGIVGNVDLDVNYSLDLNKK